MKNIFKPTLLLGLMAMLAVGCTPNTSSSEGGDSTSEPEATLTAEEFELAFNHIAMTVPLAVEKTVGVTIQTNLYRAAHDLAMPVLKGGNDIALTTSGALVYEDEENDVYLYPNYTVSWAFLDNESYGSFEFETDRAGVYTAVPGYPTYLPEYDGGGNPTHVVPNAKSARLYALIKIGDHEKRANIDLVLEPQQIIEYVSLLEVRERNAGDVVGVRGYVHGIFPDWNTAGIGDGRWGLGLYRLDSGFKDSMQIGELVEVVGQVSNFNGLSQLQYIKSVKILDPAEWTDIKEPAIQVVSLDDLEDQLSRAKDDLTGPLQDKDNSILRFSEPLRFKRVEDRNGVEVGFAGFDLTGKVHTNVILGGTTSANKNFEVKLSINYHMLGENQEAFKTWLQAHQSDDIYYTGAISAYNELVLGPYEFVNNVTLSTTYLG